MKHSRSIRRGNTSQNLADSTSVITVQQAPLAALSTSIVSIPTTGVTGQAASPAISWIVTNTSSTAAQGNWVDSVYLSSSTTYDSNAVLIATVTHNGGLAGGSSYTASTTANLPAEIVPGNYYVIVRADSLGVVPETSRSANEAVSTGTVAMSLQALTLGTPTTGTIAAGQNVYYQVSVTAGQTLNLAGNFSAAYAAAFYVSYGKPPTTTSYDQVYQQQSDLNQTISIPNTTAGTYYILLARSASAGGSVSYQLTASEPAFGINSINLTHGSDQGSVTLTVTGAELAPTAQVQLVSSHGTVYNASRILWFSASTLWVTFDLTQTTPGVYSVQAIDNGSTSTLTNAFTVDNSAAGSLQVSASAPGVIRAGTTGQVTFYYSNAGNTDIPAPLLLLTATGAQLEQSDGTYTASAQILGINTTGPAGTLPPGFSGAITYNFELNAYVANAANTYSFNISSLGSTSSIVNWASLKTASQPAQVSTTAWNAIWQNLLTSTGNTLGSFQAMLGTTATYLSQLNDYTNSISTLLGFKYTQANDGLLPTPIATATDISIPAPGLALSLSRSFYSTISSRNQAGILGIGWLTPWDIKLISTSNGDEIVNLTTAQIEFTPNATGGFTGPDGGGSLALVNGNYVYTDATQTSYGFTASGALSYLRDKNGNQITASFTNSLITTLTQSDGAYLNLTYTPSGYVSQITGSNGEVVNYTYDNSGQYLQSAATYGGTTSYTYDLSTNITVNNALASITNPDGSHRYFTYDSVGRLSQTTGDLASQTTTYNYDTDGGITITDNAGDSTSVMLTESLKPGREIDPLGNVTEIEYGGDGNPTEEILPGGLVYHFQYDSSGRIVGMNDPLGDSSSFSYLGSTDLLSSYTNPLGATTSYSYDASYNMTGITEPGGATQSESYNSLGEVTGSTDARLQQTTDTYNSAGQLAREQFSDGSYDVFTYDSHGDILTMTDSSGLTTYNYNTACELTSIDYPNGHILTYQYDAGGRRTQMTDETGYMLNYSYNADGQLAKVMNATNQPIASYTYDADGRVSQQTDQNGSYTTYQYDAAGDVVQLTNYNSTNTPTSAFAYTYDALNRVATETTLNGEWAYAYDSDSQLISAVFTPSMNSPIAAQTISYTYDSAGNRLETIDNNQVVGYTTNSRGEYTTVGSTNYVYDADGNLTSDGVNSYSYNSQNELTQIVGGGNITTYTYDGLGHVVSETFNNQTVAYVLDPATGQQIDTFSINNGIATLSAQNTFGNGLVDTAQNGSTFYYSYDATGSTAGLTNSTGTSAGQYSYDPFGNLLAGSSSQQTPYLFLGESGAVTGPSGLITSGTTLLNTLLGRMQSPASTLADGAVNPYAYLNNAWTSSTNVDGNGLSILATEIVSGIASNLKPQAFGIAGPLFSSTGQQAAASFSSVVAGGISTSLTTAKSTSTGGLGTSGLTTVQTGLGGGTTTTGTTTTPHGGGLNSSTLPPPSALSGASLNTPTTGGSVASTGSFTGTRGSTQGYQSTSLDPNAINGPLGYGPAQTIGIGSSQVFQIDFENLATATAPAQVVTVVTQLDSSWDWHTFQLQSMSFDHYSITVPNGQSFYSTIIDERPNGVNLLVEVSAGLNPQTGLVTMRLASIDPDTGVAPADPNIGALPQNNANNDGTGTLVYSIRGKSTVTTGTIISSQATVTFDSQPPLSTNIWTNALDTALPTTTLTALTPTAPTRQLTVSWTGTDAAGGSGIASYNIYVSTDGGASYQPWLSATQLTSATYVVAPGQTYSFYAIAYDNAGDSSAVPAQPQATVTIPANTFVAGSIFYNNSSYNGNNTTANSADDNAIATDKTPLLPGQTATFANYTSYSKGINGIFVDLAGSLSTLSASDFAFTEGNSSMVSLWSTAPSPSISLRLIDSGTVNRVTLIWPDNQIQNTWLSITVLANSDTGLTTPVTFYFGNAIGSTGDSTVSAAVNTRDALAARSHEAAGVSVTNVYDFNRDGSVNNTDVTIAQTHGTSGRAVLQLISPPSSGTPSPLASPAAMIAAPVESTGTSTPSHAHKKKTTVTLAASHRAHATAKHAARKAAEVARVVHHKHQPKKSVDGADAIKHPLD